jgi:lipoprotein NlpD
MPPLTLPPLTTTAYFGRHFRRIAAAALIGLLAACATRVPAPVVERSPAPKPAPVEVARTPVAPPAPEPDWRPQTHTVKRGDTLHQIALDYGLDYRELAAWNNVENPNLIRVGQVLRLAAPGEPGAVPAGPGVTVTPLGVTPPVVAGDARTPPPAAAAGEVRPPAPLASAVAPRNTDNYKTQPKAVKEPYSERALREVQRAAAEAPPPAAAAAAPTAAQAATSAAAPAAATAGAMAATAPPPPPTVVARVDPKPEPRGESRPAPAAGDDENSSDKIDWLWPATGKLVTGFSDTANLKGIDIAGKAGQPVVATAAGKVVYAGTGLRGYGKLVIVKHNNTFLSAYAHNNDILVKEGQQVSRGQKIAEMGDTDSDQVKLHFEIRRLGKPVDPLKYLPPA